MEEHPIIAEQRLVWEQLTLSYEKGRMSHAYLFEGTDHSRLREIAILYTQLLLCQQATSHIPCGNCSNCRRVKEGNHPNVLTLVRETTQIRKEQIDELIRQMSQKGFEKGKKVYMIEEADRMNLSAANALLKFLEEPAGDVVAILMTEAPAKMLPTIQSRCQKISFVPPTREHFAEHLQNIHGLTPSMAATLAMLTLDEQEAITLLEDQFKERRALVLDFMKVIETNSQEALLFVYQQWLPLMKEREDVERGLDLLLYIYRDIVTVKAGRSTMLAYPDQREQFEQYALRFTYAQLSERMDRILQAKQFIDSNMNRTLLVEQLVLNMQEGFTFV